MKRNGSSILVPLTYLGPVGYYKQILQAGKVFLEVYEHYVKQTYRNRCRIAAANGPLNLIIPVVKVDGNHTRMIDIQVDYQQKWQINHWRAITSAYNKSPYFIYYAPDLEPFFFRQFTSLPDFNLQLTKLVIDLIGESVLLETTNKYIAEPEKDVLDLRGYFSPKKRSSLNQKKYRQVFIEKLGFIPDLSILDVLFNLGPAARAYLLELPD